MCYFGNLDGTSIIEQFLQICFLVAACLVHHVGLILSILLFGLLPLYIYGYFAFRDKSYLSKRKGKICGTLSVLLTITMLAVLWVAAAIIDTWG